MRYADNGDVSIIMLRNSPDDSVFGLASFLNICKMCVIGAILPDIKPDNTLACSEALLALIHTAGIK